MFVASRNAARAWLTGLAVLMLIAGLIVGGLALAAAVGVWLGFWNFGRGFQLLGFANGQGDLVAIVGVVVTVVIFAIAWRLGARNGPKLAGLALIGTVAAALAYYVPETYRPPEGTPGIHDISTDTADPPTYVAILPLRAEAPNTVEYGASPNMTPARLAELTREAYPDLRPAELDVPTDVAFERALAAVRSLGWELVDQDAAQGRIEAVDTTFWFRFKDDIVIRIRPSATGSIVDARSLSRVGVGDAGTNARRLQGFFDVL
jgi:uncharacterized protein (DUF1499 family)